VVCNRVCEIFCELETLYIGHTLKDKALSLSQRERERGFVERMTGSLEPFIAQAPATEAAAGGSPWRSGGCWAYEGFQDARGLQRLQLMDGVEKVARRPSPAGDKPPRYTDSSGMSWFPAGVSGDRLGSSPRNGLTPCETRPYTWGATGGARYSRFSITPILAGGRGRRRSV
jgi:hypothetical protein